MNLIKMRKLWYAISLVIIVPGVISLALWGLKPSIDFTGGTRIEFSNIEDQAKFEEIATSIGFENFTVVKSGSGLIFRTETIDVDKDITLKTDVESQITGAKQVSLETVGPSVSSEATRNAFILVAVSCLVIVMYIAIMFRKVAKPVKSYEFGVAAIIALLHDTLVLLGIFSILGHFLGVEVDPLFITALLTIIGFSVHDTIVIFDRIRENSTKGTYVDFETTAAVSVYEMLPRTLNTSFLVWVILLVLFAFGGESIKYFVLALVIGVFSGTYSSILNATPLLVTWQLHKEKPKRAKSGKKFKLNLKFKS